MPGQGRLHGERELGRLLRVVPAGRRDSAGDHVSVSDGLDLLQPVIRNELVERREDLVEEADHIFGRQPLDRGREAAEISEEHRDVLVPLGDDATRRLQALGDRRREDVQEETLGALALRHEKPMGAFASANEVLKQEERRQGDACDVQREERDRDTGGDARNAMRKL